MPIGKVWIYRLLFVCVCVLYVFVRRLIGVKAENLTFWGTLLSQKPKTGLWIGQHMHWTIIRTRRSLAYPAGLGWLKSERRSVYSSVSAWATRAAFGRRLACVDMCQSHGRKFLLSLLLLKLENSTIFFLI